MIVECFGYFRIQIYIKSLFLNEVLGFGCSSLVVLHFPSLSTQFVFVLFKEFVLTHLYDFEALFMFMNFQTNGKMVFRSFH